MGSSMVRRTGAAVLFFALLGSGIGSIAAGVARAQTPAAPTPKAAAPAPSGAAPRVPSVPRAAPITGVVNINTASAEELVLLPGVGPARAKAIVAYRTAQGPFKKLDDLANVSGIGAGNLKRVLPFCTLDGKTTAQRAGAH